MRLHNFYIIQTLYFYFPFLFAGILFVSTNLNHTVPVYAMGLDLLPYNNNNNNNNNDGCIDRSEWMRNALWVHNQTLYEITLPGTHDSGAYMLYNSYLRGFVSNWIEEAMELAQMLHIDVYHIVKMWALSQAGSPRGSVAGQLRAGARYIDLRCSWNGTDWITFHFEQGVLCNVLMRDISDFLRAYHGEIVYVEFGSEWSPNRKEPGESIMKLLYDDIRDMLFPFHIPVNSNLRSLTVAQLVEANTRCLIASPHRPIEYENEIFVSDSIIYNTYADTDVLQDMIAYNDERVAEFREWKTKKNKQFYKVSWTLTPGARAVTESIIPGNPRSLYELSEPAFQEIIGWSQAHAAEAYPRFGQILISDFFCESNVFEVFGPQPNERTPEKKL
jgi:hypothetical protein